MENSKSNYHNIYARVCPKKNVCYQHKQNNDRDMDMHSPF